MEKDKFIALLSKKLSGQIAPEETEELNSITLENEEYLLLAIKLESYFHKKENPKPNTEQLNKVWRMIQVGEKKGFDEKMDYPQPNIRTSGFSKLLKVAAVLIVLIGTGMLGYKLLNKNVGQHFETVITANGKTFRMLDDGTKVWLNKNSKLSYNAEFGQYKREIILEGEAYFDVVKNKDVPLFIHVGNIDIEVKGTAFNVNAHKGSDKIQVALVRGLIQLTDRLDSKRKVLLHPNEKFTLNNSKNNEQYKFLVKSMESEALLNDVNWIADTLIFNKEKLKDLAIRMEKKYDLKIEIYSEKLKDKRFSGTFINENIQQALEALKLSYPLTYTINNRLVVIKDAK